MSEAQGAAELAPGSPTSTEVSWNTIFYTLLTLALSTMAQPVGSVLGTNPISRTYLRSSPVFCIFDTTAFLIEITILRFSSSKSWREAVTKASERRFRDIDGGHENPEVFRTESLFRWVAFILGTHGCIIKLAGAEGIPWTKMWALAYVVSFCVFEGMVAIRSKTTQIDFGNESDDPPAPIPSATATAGLYCAICATIPLVVFETGGVICSVIAHFENNPAGVHIQDFRAWLWGAIFSVPLWLVVITMMLNPLLSTFLAARPHVGERLLLLDKRKADEIRFNWFTYEDKYRDAVEMCIRPMTMYALHLFLFSLIFGLPWYMFAYDPAGTLKAAWADVFG